MQYNTTVVVVGRRRTVLEQKERDSRCPDTLCADVPMAITD
jgi:hypothetical protein